MQNPWRSIAQTPPTNVDSLAKGFYRDLRHRKGAEQQWRSVQSRLNALGPRGTAVMRSTEQPNPGLTGRGSSAPSSTGSSTPANTGNSPSTASNDGATRPHNRRESGGGGRSTDSSPRVREYERYRDAFDNGKKIAVSELEALIEAEGKNGFYVASATCSPKNQFGDKGMKGMFGIAKTGVSGHGHADSGFTGAMRFQEFKDWEAPKGNDSEFRQEVQSHSVENKDGDVAFDNFVFRKNDKSEIFGCSIDESRSYSTFCCQISSRKEEFKPDRDNTADADLKAAQARFAAGVTPDIAKAGATGVQGFWSIWRAPFSCQMSGGNNPNPKARINTNFDLGNAFRDPFEIQRVPANRQSKEVYAQATLKPEGSAMTGTATLQDKSTEKYTIKGDASRPESLMIEWEISQPKPGGGVTTTQWLCQEQFLKPSNPSDMDGFKGKRTVRLEGTVTGYKTGEDGKKYILLKTPDGKVQEVLMDEERGDFNHPTLSGNIPGERPSAGDDTYNTRSSPMVGDVINLAVDQNGKKLEVADRQLYAHWLVGSGDARNAATARIRKQAVRNLASLTALGQSPEAFRAEFARLAELQGASTRIQDAFSNPKLDLGTVDVMSESDWVEARKLAAALGDSGPALDDRDHWIARSEAFPGIQTYTPEALLDLVKQKTDADRDYDVQQLPTWKSDEQPTHRPWQHFDYLVSALVGKKMRGNPKSKAMLEDIIRTGYAKDAEADKIDRNGFAFEYAADSAVSYYTRLENPDLNFLLDMATQYPGYHTEEALESAFLKLRKEDRAPYMDRMNRYMLEFLTSRSEYDRGLRRRLIAAVKSESQAK